MKNTVGPVNLTKQLAHYKSGWVALDKKNKVIAHAKDFDSICSKVKDSENVLLIPASKSYFGFVTKIDG